MYHHAFRLMICGVLLVLVAACAAQPTSTRALQSVSSQEAGASSQMDGISSRAEPPQPRVEEITFQSGPFRVVGDLRLPAGSGPHPAVLWVHGDGPADRTEFGSLLPLMERVLRAGYAVFSWDKPGTGESTGTIDRSHLIQQRTQIVLDAIAVMKARPDIDSHQIGLAGISQAGYVMPRAISLSKDIAFMLAVSCPGMAGNDQTAYLFMSQALCAGVPAEKADEKTRLLAELDKARTYKTYAEYLRYREIIAALAELAANPEWSNLPGIVPEKEWQAKDPADLESYWNPMGVVEQTRMPVLALFGEKDTQLDPFQGARAYGEALERKSSPHSRVILYPDVSHNMMVAETGCMSEKPQLAADGSWPFAPGLLDTLEVWLGELRR
jgi:pimeloyl-ACP methyl ester carboxylesterase